MAEKRPTGRQWQKQIEERVTEFLDSKQRAVMDFTKVGQEIKERRKALGVSQESLAQIAGVAFRTVNRLEQGIPAPRSVDQILYALTTLEKAGKKRASKKAR